MEDYIDPSLRKEVTRRQEQRTKGRRDEPDREEAVRNTPMEWYLQTSFFIYDYMLEAEINPAISSRMMAAFV